MNYEKMHMKTKLFSQPVLTEMKPSYDTMTLGRFEGKGTGRGRWVCDGIEEARRGWCVAE